jgi:RNA polymerase sigma factor (sigma-70 family)
MSYAFNQTVLDTRKYLKPFALKLTQDIVDAEDLIQDTMYRVFSNENKFQEGTNLKAWIYTIMKNIFINNYRKKIKQNIISDTTDNQYYLNSSAFTFNAGERSFVMNDIQNAILKIDADYRVPFMMYFNGYKYHEISEQLNIPIGTVKSRIFFARKDLKHLLQPYKELY